MVRYTTIIHNTRAFVHCSFMHSQHLTLCLYLSAGYTRGAPVPPVCRQRWFTPPPAIDAYMVYVNVKHNVSQLSYILRDEISG